MFQFNIANLQISEASFKVPSALGEWEFNRTANYDDAGQHIDAGMCAHTYIATNASVNFSTRRTDVGAVLNEIVDICLFLSFLNARCVAPTGTTAWSQPQIIALGDQYIKPRAILGFDQLTASSLTALFSGWLTGNYAQYRQRNLRLQLTHWLSGLTCFSLEDIYLSVGVQMDLIKQVERSASSRSRLTYFEGMRSASTRYGLTPLSHDYKNMRNDIVHEGCLSGSNFPNRSKLDCADVIASALNWIDLYLLNVLGVSGTIRDLPRWRAARLITVICHACAGPLQELAIKEPGDTSPDQIGPRSEAIAGIFFGDHFTPKSEPFPWKNLAGSCAGFARF